MNDLISVTADQLRFCRLGYIRATIKNVSSSQRGYLHFVRGVPFLDWDQDYGECLSEIISAEVNPEEFSASVLANIEMWMPGVDKISKRLFPDGRLTIVAEGPTIHQNIKISADPAPWLDSYEFSKVDGVWRME